MSELLSRISQSSHDGKNSEPVRARPFGDGKGAQSDYPRDERREVGEAKIEEQRAPEESGEVQRGPEYSEDL